MNQDVSFAPYISSKDSEPRWMVNFRSSGVWLSKTLRFT